MVQLRRNDCYINYNKETLWWDIQNTETEFLIPLHKKSGQGKQQIGRCVIKVSPGIERDMQQFSV